MTETLSPYQQQQVNYGNKRRTLRIAKHTRWAKPDKDDEEPIYLAPDVSNEKPDDKPSPAEGLPMPDPADPYHKAEIHVDALYDDAWSKKSREDGTRWTSEESNRAARAHPIMPTRAARMKDLLDAPYATRDNDDPMVVMPYAEEIEDGDDGEAITPEAWRAGYKEWLLLMNRKVPLTTAPLTAEQASQIRSGVVGGKYAIGGALHTLLMDDQGAKKQPTQEAIAAAAGMSRQTLWRRRKEAERQQEAGEIVACATSVTKISRKCQKMSPIQVQAHAQAQEARCRSLGCGTTSTARIRSQSTYHRSPVKDEKQGARCLGRATRQPAKESYA